MHARVSFFQLSEGENVFAAVKKGFDDFIPGIQQMDGSKGLLLMTDRNGRRAITITLWDSEESLYSTLEQTDTLRRQAAAAAGLSIQSVEHYEVVTDER